jgi:hypothetical protein
LRLSQVRLSGRALHGEAGSESPNGVKYRSLRVGLFGFPLSRKAAIWLASYRCVFPKALEASPWLGHVPVCLCESLCSSEGSKEVCALWATSRCRLLSECTAFVPGCPCRTRSRCLDLLHFSGRASSPMLPHCGNNVVWTDLQQERVRTWILSV